MTHLAKYCCNPIMGMTNYAWDTRVNSRASIVYDAASQYYYMSFEGSRSTDCSTPGANWGWGIARSSSLDNPSWTKYTFNPIRQTYNVNSCGNDIPYIFKFNGQIYVYQRAQGQRNILTPGTDPYLKVYLSVNNGQGQCELYSTVGRPEGSPPGWSARSTDPNGWLCFGPSVVLPAGEYAIGFRDLIDVNSGFNSGDHVIAQGVYDDTDPNNRIWVFSNDILRSDFSNANQYQNFYYQFNQVSGHSLQFTTNFFSKAYIRQYLVMVRQIS